MEVLVALLLLGLVLGSTMAFAARATASVQRAQRDWADAHALTQASEFFLVTNPRYLVVPDQVLPPGYRATCSISDGRGDLPENARATQSGWALARYDIGVTTPDGRTLAPAPIYKLLPEKSW